MTVYLHRRAPGRWRGLSSPCPTRGAALPTVERTQGQTWYSGLIAGPEHSRAELEAAEQAMDDDCDRFSPSILASSR